MPVNANGRIVAVISVMVDASGHAKTGAFASWEGAFQHPVTATQASAAAAPRGDSVKAIERVWAIVSPMQRGPAPPTATSRACELRSSRRARAPTASATGRFRKRSSGMSKQSEPPRLADER